jgi:lantibiotic biosynthesis protein
MLPSVATEKRWRPAAGLYRDDALDRAHVVAHRLATPERVEAAVLATRAKTRFARGVDWRPCSLAQGCAGLAMLYAYCDACFPDEQWDLLARDYLKAAAEDAGRSRYLHLGIFSGLTGVAFAIWLCSRGGERYQRLHAALDGEIFSRVPLAAQQLRTRHEMYVSEFDLVSGLSGTGAYLLCRLEKPEARAALEAIVDTFSELALDDCDPPRWYTPPHLLGDKKTIAYYPHGNLNLGLAHGIPGPLAMLALAYKSEIQPQRAKEAIIRLANCIIDHKLEDEWGPSWPIAVPFGPDADPAGPGRCAWCYGPPGVARALWVAGEAVDRDDFKDLALESMRAVFRRPIPERRIDSPTFCHGVSGLLAITLRFAHDTGNHSFQHDIAKLIEQILGHYQPDSLLGFCNIEIEDHQVDQPALLDGAPGVALALLAASTGIEPVWDRLFLLS